MKPEENSNTQAANETTGNLHLNGEAWKNRDNKTYTSLLDRYGAAELFSEESMKLYQEMAEAQRAKQQELTAYVFSGHMQTKSEEENMADYIFSQEIRFSKLQDYSRKEDDYSICFIMAEILFVLVFIYILLKMNVNRKKRRESYAAEVNLES